MECFLFEAVVVEVGVGLGDRLNDSIVGWFASSGFRLYCCWSSSGICSVAASATSFETYLKNANAFFDEFVREFE